MHAYVYISPISLGSRQHTRGLKAGARRHLAALFSQGSSFRFLPLLPPHHQDSQQVQLMAVEEIKKEINLGGSKGCSVFPKQLFLRHEYGVLDA